MKAIIGAIIVVVALFFVVPMVAGGTTNTCQALEKQSVSNAATSIAGSNTGVIHNTINSIGQAGATGDVASQTMAAQHPDTPSPVSCTYYYWKSMI
jgi:hypothetical protein